MTNKPSVLTPTRIKELAKDPAVQNAIRYPKGLALYPLSGRGRTASEEDNTVGTREAKQSQLLQDAYGVTPSMQETIRLFFMQGPIWDGNLPSKPARNELADRGMVARCHGFNYLTTDGMIFAVKMMGLGAEKNT